MKVKIVNVFQATGLSKKDNKPFSISRATILCDFENVNTANYQRSGAGLGMVEVSVSDDFYPMLEKHVADRFQGGILEIDVRTSFGRRGDMVITGLDGQSSAAPVSPVQGPRAAA